MRTPKEKYNHMWGLLTNSVLSRSSDYFLLKDILDKREEMEQKEEGNGPLCLRIHIHRISFRSNEKVYLRQEAVEHRTRVSQYRHQAKPEGQTHAI